MAENLIKSAQEALKTTRPVIQQQARICASLLATNSLVELQLGDLAVYCREYIEVV